MESTLRTLVAFGLTLLLVMLRAEAERFGAAEYDEPIGGQPPSLLRRLAWYAVGLGGVVAIEEIIGRSDRAAVAGQEHGNRQVRSLYRIGVYRETTPAELVGFALAGKR